MKLTKKYEVEVTVDILGTVYNQEIFNDKLDFEIKHDVAFAIKHEATQHSSRTTIANGSDEEFHYYHQTPVLITVDVVYFSLDIIEE